MSSRATLKSKIGGERRDPATKLAEQRLSVLELARELGNVAEACRRRGLDRTSFYKWKRRFQTQGFEDLKDLCRRSTSLTRRRHRRKRSSGSRSWRWNIRPTTATGSRRC